MFFNLLKNVEQNHKNVYLLKILNNLKQNQNIN